MPVSPRTPPGVLELLPPQQIAFQRMLDTIRRGFERFGFLPIETPVFELTDVLLTKSGGETEKQVYFVQSTGALKQGDTPDMALRFDLTVPLARYVAQHENDLNFPFRRYQIQRVYRGERAQKGRYREFYQCDIDVIARDHLPLAYDAELPAVIYGIFSELKIADFRIYLNNRKLLRGMLEGFQIAADKQPAVLHVIDRLGKQPRGEIEAQLVALDISQPDVKYLLGLLTTTGGDSDRTFANLENFDHATPMFREGLDELRQVYLRTLALKVPQQRIELNLAIVRGLDYYTGTIYETFFVDHPEYGSICSGGRYADLAGLYTKSKLPGVGISIGLTRLFSRLLDDPNMTDVVSRTTITDVLIVSLDPELDGACSEMAADLRRAVPDADRDLNVELYSDDRAPDKKLKHVGKYIDRAKVPFAIFYGARDRDAGVVQVKDLRGDAEKKLHEFSRKELVVQIRELKAGAGRRGQVKAL